MSGPSDTQVALAVDVGGTKLAAGLADANGRLLASRRVATPTEGGGEAVWAALDVLVHDVLALGAGPPPSVCGIGCGGPMSQGGGRVSPLNIPGWREFPLATRVADATGLPTFVDNDAKALALAEGSIGTAAGHRAFIAMVVSTGIGGGIVLDGRLLDGRLGNAGHIGHVVVEPEGRPCACGGRGCVEAEASGTAITAVTGRPPTAAPAAIVERSGTLVGRAVASVAALLDLDLAVVSGSVALGFGTPFFTAARRELAARARLSYCAGTRIVPSVLGPAGPLLGAAAVGWRGLGASRSAEGAELAPEAG